jgi:hypothetical protein
MERARGGVRTTLNEAAEHVSLRPEGGGMKVATVARYLKGKVPLEKAKCLADSVAANASNARRREPKER